MTREIIPDSIMKIYEENKDEELKKLTEEMIEAAKNVRKDYEKNPSEISGSVVSVHETSPFVDERLPDGPGWKKVIINNPPPKLKIKK